jgi:hypothetical protein
MLKSSDKAPIDSLVFEPLNTATAHAQAMRRMAIECESVREGVAAWIDNVIRDAADHRRQVTVVRFHRTLAGYMILKPWEQKISSIWVETKFRDWGQKTTPKSSEPEVMQFAKQQSARIIQSKLSAYRA